MPANDASHPVTVRGTGLAEILLIALTGYGQESDRRRTREAGFHDHLVKPVDIDALEATLKAGS
jgi:CheY-like chemotaxis protein